MLTAEWEGSRLTHGLSQSTFDRVTIGASERVSQAKGSAAPNECIG